MAGILAGSLSIEVIADIARLQKDLDKVKSLTAGMSNEVSRSTKAANDNFAAFGRSAGGAEVMTRKLATAVAALGIAGVGATFANLTRQAVQFQDSMAEVSTLIDTTRVSVDKLSQSALDQARAFGSSPLEQSKALYQIISAGAATAAQATATLTAANRLAAGGVTDVKTAADGLTSILNAFGRAGGSATDVSDAMFIAMKSGKTTIAELSSTLGKVAPLAASTGVSFDELAASVSALTKGGIATSEAVTGVRAILAAVAKPSDEASKLADKLGLSFDATALKAKGFAAFLSDIKAKTGGSQDALAQLFGGVEALVPVLALSGQAGVDFTNILKDMGMKAGATEAAFQKIAASPGFQWHQLLAEMQVRGIELGTTLLQVLVPAMGLLSANLDGVIHITGAAVAGFVTYRAVLLATAAAEALAGGSVGILIGHIVKLTAMFGLQAGAAASAAAATSLLGSAVRGVVSAALGPLGIALMAAAVAYEFFRDKTIEAGQASAAANAMAAQSSQMAQAVEKAQMALATATGTGRAAALANAEALRQSSIQMGANATEAYKAARAHLVLANAMAQEKVGKAIKLEMSGPVGQAISWIGGYRKEAEAAAKVAADARAEFKQTQQTLIDWDKNQQKLNASIHASVPPLVALGGAAGGAGKKGADASKEFKEFADGLTDAIARFGKTEAEIKALDNAAKAAAAEKAGFPALAASIRILGTVLVNLEKQAAVDEGLKKAGQAAADASRDFDKLLASVEAEGMLIGLTGAARERAALDLERAGFMADHAAMGLLGAAAAWKKYHDASAANIDKNEAIERENAALQHQLDLLSQFRDHANSIGDALANAFGKGGSAIADMIGAVGDLSVKMGEYEQARAKAGITREEIAALDRKAVDDQLTGLQQVLHAGKSLFAEHSQGYKAMAVAEKTLAAFRAAEAAVAVGRMAIDVAAGAAKMFGQGGFAGFAGVAAMAAVMAGLGFAVSGGGGGARPPSAEELQKAQGTGSVLGDTSAKSGSIANALDIMSRNSNADLEYSSDMVRSLRAIENGIGALTSQLARQLNLSGGAFDTSGMSLGSSMGKSSLSKLIMAVPGMALLGEIPIIGNLVSGIVKALFGTKKTVSVLDQGITFAGQQVEDIINNGTLVGQLYQDIQTVTKKKFFGITTSTKTSVSTSYTGVDDDMERQVAMIIGSMRAGIIDAAGMLGIEGAQATLDAFTVNIGKISLKDLSGEEIQAQLEAVFSKVGDDMANAALPGLAAFQQVGEGIFETLSRLAKDYQTIDVALQSIGKTFGMVGFASIDARENLISLFGGLDEFASQTGVFRDKFLSEAEQMAPIISAVQGEMARLGQAGITTKGQFKDLVLGLDLSSAAGQEMFASLMAVAPAFAKVDEYLVKLNGTVVETGLTLEQLAAIEKERQSLQLRLLDLTDAAAAQAMRRELERAAALSDANRAMLDEIYMTEDLAAAARAAADAQAAQAAEAAKLAQEAEAAAQALAQAVAAIADQYKDLTLRLLDLTDVAAAQAMRRDLELAAALSDQNRAKLLEIFATEDAIAAEKLLTDARTAAADTAAAIADQYKDLTLRLLDLTDVAAAQAMRRDLELAAALSEANRAKLLEIHAAEDAAAAAKLAADAQAAQAEAAERLAQAAQAAAEAIAQAAAAVAREYQDLTLRLLDLTDAGAAQAMRRDLELAAALSDQNRAKLLEIYSVEDSIKAAADAAAAQKALADAQAEAARVAEEAAKAAAQRLADARNVVADAYDRENGALKETIKTFGDFGTSLREFRAGLSAADAGTAMAYRQAQVKFLMTSSLAQAGDAKALGDLQGVSSAFLEASRSQASTAIQYQRDVSAVARAVDAAIGAADSAVNYAQAQLTAMDRMVAGILDVNRAVLTLPEALAEYWRIEGGDPPADPSAPMLAYVTAPSGSGQSQVAQATPLDLDVIRDEVRLLREQLIPLATSIKDSTNRSANVDVRNSVIGMPIRNNNQGEPLNVEVS